MNTYHLDLPSITASIKQIEPFLRSIGELSQLNAQKYHDMLVAVTEAVNNAIIHGNKLDETKPVTVDVQTDSVEVIVVVCDCGGGFDPSAIPDPRLPENILREGGRGVFLIRHLADSAEFNISDSGLAVMLKYVF